MKRDSRQFEPQVTRVGNAPSRVRFTLKCHQCPTEDYVDGGRGLPDDVVSKKFKQRGWLLGRNRSYDVCPKCLGVTQENALANVFKVTDANGPVPSAAEIAKEAAEAQRDAVAKAHDALDRFLPTPAPKTLGCGFADRTSDPMLAMMAHDMSEVRAALERMADQGDRRDALLDKTATNLARQTEIFERQTEGYEKHLMYFERLIDQMERQNRAQEQTIRAIAGIVPTVVRTSEGMTSGVRAALAQMVEELLPRLPVPAPTPVYPPEAELGIPADTEDVALMPAPVQTVEHVTAVPAEAPVEPKPWRTKASASVTSYMDTRKEGRFLTHISVDRKVWDAMGYTLEDRFDIEGNSEWGVVIRRAEQGGVKPKRVGTKTVIFQTRNVGDLNYKRLHTTIGFGEIRI